jgi:hypothetical protein
MEENRDTVCRIVANMAAIEMLRKLLVSWLHARAASKDSSAASKRQASVLKSSVFVYPHDWFSKVVAKLDSSAAV